jgi:hypothetical protein
MLKKMSGFLAVVFCITTIAGCSPAWWQAASDNPAMVASSLSVQVHTFLGSAEIVYAAASALLPADKKAEVDAQYQKATLAVNHALTALEDAAQVAQETHADKPNLAKEVSGVLAAVQELSTIVDLFKSIAAPKVGGVTPRVDLTGAFADLDQQKKLIARHGH